jgi:hypothetical protein
VGSQACSGTGELFYRLCPDQIDVGCRRRFLCAAVTLPVATSLKLENQLDLFPALKLRIRVDLSSQLLK